MAEVATMYLMGIGVEKSEENALEWFKKAFDYGNVSVRGKLLQVQQSIDARRKAERTIKSLKKRAKRLFQSQACKKRNRLLPELCFFRFPVIGMIGLSLAIIFFNTIKKSGSPDNESPSVVPEIAAASPDPKLNWSSLPFWRPAPKLMRK